jgi:hypothetical protein
MNGQAELGKLLTSGSTGGNNGAVEAGLGDNVDLNGGVTARVVHGTSVNLGDRHFEYRRSDEREDQSDCKRRRKKKQRWQ